MVYDTGRGIVLGDNKMEISKQLKHFFNVGIGTIFNIFLGLLTTPIVTRLVDTSDYGALSMFNTYTSMAVMVLCLGLDQSLIRFYYEDESENYKRRLISKTAGVSISIALIVCIIAFFVLNSGMIPFDFNGTLLFFLLLYVLVQLFLRFVLLVLRVEYQTKLYASLNVLNKIIYLVAALLMITFAGYSNNLHVLIFATVISSIIPLMVGIYKNRNLWIPGKWSDRICIDNKIVLRYGFPFILSMGITTLFETLDKLSINYFCDYSDVGIYASAITIVNVFTIIQTTFNTIWAPMSIEKYTRAPDDYSFFKNLNSLITVLMFGFGFFVIVLKDAFILLLGAKYRSASCIVPFLIFHPIMYTISETTAIGIDFKQKSYLHIVVAIVACVVNAIGNVILVPIIGGQGAAISTGVSYIVFFTMRTILGLINYNYKPSIIRIYILILMTFFYAFYSSFVSFNILTIVIYIICLIVTFLLYENVIIDALTYILNLVRRTKGEG